MGLPNSSHDEDVTAPLPKTLDTDLTGAGKTIHVQICQLLGEVMSRESSNRRLKTLLI
jgi:hypothetical protein